MTLLLARHAQAHPMRIILADVDSDAGFFDPPSPLLDARGRHLRVDDTRPGGHPLHVARAQGPRWPAESSCSISPSST